MPFADPPYVGHTSITFSIKAEAMYYYTVGRNWPMGCEFTSVLSLSIVYNYLSVFFVKNTRDHSEDKQKNQGWCWGRVSEATAIYPIGTC